MSKRLEIQMDYDLYSEDEQRLAVYMSEMGMTEAEAATQVAQDIFGPHGGIVQLVDVIDV